MSSTEPEAQPPRSALGGALGCLGMYLFFGAVLVVPHLALALAPAAGLGAAALAQLMWNRFAPPAMPGLVPGLMHMTVLIHTLVVIGVAISRLIGR